MKLAVFASLLFWAGSASAQVSEKIGESCTGTETVQVGTQAPKKLPYALTFSADLSAKTYCYDKCGPDQTYPISDSASNPIKLADTQGGQEREMTFDRLTAILTDYQSYDAGLGRIIRRASAKCQSAAFHAPAALTKLKP